MKHRFFWMVCLFFLIFPATGFASGVSTSFEKTTILFLVILTLAKWSGFLFEKLGLPELVGELVAGVLLGNKGLIGIDFNLTHTLLTSHFMEYAAELGLIILLFEAGLESNVRDLLTVGPNALFVAIIGVVLPVFLGTVAANSLGITTGIGSWFIGATLAATSVGITAKILGETGVIKTPSSQVILGAAVIDDILGLILLAVLAGIVTTGSLSVGNISWIFFKASLFFGGNFLIGQALMPRLVRLTNLNPHSSFWVGFGMITALSFSQIALWAGLAPIIGAFTAGLLLDDVDFVVGSKFQKHTLEELLTPLSDILLPIFFVAIGVQVQLDALANFNVILIVLALVVIGIIGKGAAGFAARGKLFDRFGIGMAMVPRGEVGLIFASYALQHKVVTPAMYSALVIVVLLTTVLGPILLKPRLRYF